jgi:hypothetical protein
MMAAYKAYRVKNERIVDQPIVIEADTDASAIEKAKQLVDGCDVQLWEGGRFIIGLKGNG